MLKRLATLALVLFTLCGNAMASGPYIVDAGNVTALVDGEGQTLLSGADIAAIFTVREGSLYAAGKKGDYGLFDASGKRVTQERFSMIDDQGDALIFRRNGRYGAMSADSAVILPPTWDQLIFNNVNGFLGLRNGGVYSIDMKGRVADTGNVVADGLGPLSDDRMVFLNAEGRCGCLDGMGRVAIEPDFMWIGTFESGTAPAVQAERYGIIDRSGAWIVEPRYDWMERGDGILAALERGKALDVYDLSGSLIYAIRTDAGEATVVGECVVVREADAARLYNRLGRCIYEASARALFLPGVDGQVILSEGRWGSAGQRIVNPSGIAGEGRYQRLIPLCANRYAFMTMQGAEYYSGDLDSLQISWDYDSIRFGMIDGGDQVLLSAQYLEIRPTGDDRLVLVSEDAVSFADMDGHIIRTWPAASTTASSTAGG